MDIVLSDLFYEIREGNQPRILLNYINQEFEKGKVTTIAGSSGSGKSTLLYALAGILPITNGDVSFGNVSIYTLKENERDLFRLNNIGIVYQNMNLFSFLNVEDNIVLPYYLKKTEVDDTIKDKVTSYLDMMNLGKIHKKSINSLSGGEQQRVAILRAFIAKPQVILCDEPTGALDRGNSIDFMRLLLEMQELLKITTIIFTHDEMIFEQGNVRLRMNDGKLSINSD